MMVIGPMRLTRAVLPSMRAQGSGSIVTISGVEAQQPRLPYPLGPVRMALHGFVRVIADRYGRDGIRINCVSPGLMAHSASEFHPDWGELIPLGRFGSTEEIAAAIAFLLSPGAGYITGQTITADGGVYRTPGL